jgi:hypothetical protein
MRSQIFGLRVASRELASQPKCYHHADFIDKGWKFCPHCGVKLAFIRTCPNCGHRFTSPKAFIVHAKMHYKKPECPECKSKNVRRETPVKLGGAKKEYNQFQQTFRGKNFHCLDCHWVWNMSTGEGKRIILERVYE